MAKSKTVNPRALHDEILTLIKEEIDVIKQQGIPKYDPEVSNLLVRYSQALSAVTKDYDEQKAQHAKKLSEMTPAELKALAKKVFTKVDLLEQGL